ncbi:uncharacterized protein LOC135823502 [Sycon ciliatum]|uniref:uncharacterized protein LOC135823502 n=1 Tax=Sycon ciliatum TaxID=27933 RepID=UPI0031F5FE4A|eukprot:scpid61183/ scgid17643/ 
MDWNKAVAVADLEPGDHIYVYLNQLTRAQPIADQEVTAQASHHGIFVGNDEVVHFCGPSTRVSSLSEAPTDDTATNKTTRSHVQDATESPTKAPVESLSFESSLVRKCTVSRFIAFGSADDAAPSTDAKVKRYRYGVKKVEANYLSSFGTCTTLVRQKPDQIVQVATFYSEHPRDFGDYETARNSEHFALFCSTCDVEIDETSHLATPPSLMVPLLPDGVLSASPAALMPNTTKGKIAAAATATCGLVAAGTMWGVTPAVLLGGAVYASAKYVTGRKNEKEQLTQKKTE